MERAALIPFLAALALLCAGCGDKALPKPDLENHPEAEWPERAKAMTTPQLYDVYRYHASLKPPYFTGFSEILGGRGRPAIALWLADLEKQGKPDMRRPVFARALITAALRRGGYDLCADPPERARAIRLLTGAVEIPDSKAAAALVDGACEAGLSKPNEAKRHGLAEPG